MNTTIFVTLTIMLTTNMIDPFTVPVNTFPSKSCESMAVRVVEALKSQSAVKFTALFPAKEEFIRVMGRNRTIYGESFDHATEEFSMKYDEEIVTGLDEEFQNLILAGEAKGLDWTRVKLADVELIGINSQSFGEAEVRILLVADGAVYRLDMENTIVIDGSWYVGPGLSLN